MPPEPGLPAESDGPASYWELDAHVPADAAELWGEFCFAQGALGAETLQEHPSLLVLRYYFDHAPEGATGWPERFTAAYPGLPAPTRLTLTERPTEPWETSWQQHFAPLDVGETFTICPPWDPRPGPGRRPLLIEPGQGFGTGQHETTALCVALLERLLAPDATPQRTEADTLLDVGTGSGILALAAGLLGLRHIAAVDVDARVMPEVRHNFALNGLSVPRLTIGGPDAVQGRYPLVVANILTEVLLAHHGQLLARTAPGGTLLLSGILRREESQILAAFDAAPLRHRETLSRGDWVALAFDRVPA